MTGLRRFGLVALLLLLAGAAWAQEADTEEAGGLQADEDRARIEWADDLRYDPAEGMYYLTGNVVFSHQDIKLYCDEATYDYDENSAVATGNPRIESEDTTITGTVIEADFDDEVATIADNVTIVTQRRRPEGEEPPSEDEEPRDLEEYRYKKTTITCEKIVYEYNEDVKRATLTGRIKAVQEDKTAYADQAVYEELEDIITLTGNVRVLTDQGDEFRCPKAVISVEEDWIRAEQVTGVAKSRPEENGGEEPSAEGTPPAEEAPPAEEPPPPEETPPAEGGGEGG